MKSINDLLHLKPEISINNNHVQLNYLNGSSQIKKIFHDKPNGSYINFKRIKYNIASLSILP